MIGRQAVAVAVKGAPLDASVLVVQHLEALGDDAAQAPNRRDAHRTETGQSGKIQDFVIIESFDCHRVDLDRRKTDPVG
jgi:hypothetical protein